MDTGFISKEFAEALVRAQGSIEGAKKGKRNPGFNSKYADLSACWDACRDALQENGIAVLQFPAPSPEGYVAIRTALICGKTGETISEVFNVPLKDKTNAQALGSAVTYGRRYALCAVIGICPEDDDGNAATSSPPKPQSSPKPEANADALRASFNGKTDVEGMKEVYKAVKNSDVPEPHKTALLKEMADAIKAAKG